MLQLRIYLYIQIKKEGCPSGAQPFKNALQAYKPGGINRRCRRRADFLYKGNQPIHREADGDNRECSRRDHKLGAVGE